MNKNSRLSLDLHPDGKAQLKRMCETLHRSQSATIRLALGLLDRALREVEKGRCVGAADDGDALDVEFLLL